MRQQLITKSRHLALFVLLVSLLGLTVLPLYSTHYTVSSAPPLVAEPMNESTNEVTVPLAAEPMSESTNEVTLRQAQGTADPLVAEPMSESESTNELSEPLVQSSDHLDALSASSTTLHAPDGECYTLYLPAVLAGSGTATTAQSNSTANGADGLDCPPPDESGPTSLVRSSPLNGEDGVAVTRETIIEFSGPIDPATVTEEAFSASFGGQTLPVRLHVSPDNTRLTLFYNEPLPASARVRVTVNGDLLTDQAGNPVDANGDSVAGGVATVDFDTLTLTVIEGTSVCGRVFASELAQSNRNTSVNVPLQGVTITVDGMEETLRTTTDSKGNFCLDPAPAGRFFVHIDGRTATNGVPEGTYYPFVGKAWESTIGQQTNVGTAHLPLVPDGTLQPVSQTEETTINLAPSVLEQFPEFADVSITVPANSLYADNGTRGGSVGIAPVPPDRLPGQLPEELKFPVVITVQTDGATNFDQPAPVCFPNLPDPDTGEPLPPGTENALFSFDHDTGRWSAVGSMTVSADGQLICTNPGVGIRAPGWHGSGPPPVGPPPPPPPPDNCPDPSSAANLQKCLKRCNEDAIRNGGTCTALAGAALVGCAIVSLGSGYPVCLGAAIAVDGICLGKAAYDGTVCADRCEEDYCPSSSFSGLDIPYNPNGVMPAGDDPVVDGITQRTQQIRELVYPYVMAGDKLPQEVQEQVDTLLAEANTLAGGDVLQYMQNYLLEKEQAVAPLEADIGEAPGSAPSYSVLYMAEIQRPNGIVLRLRGETGPDGQYTLFVPRDGTLLYVSFYDPQTKSYGIVYPRVRPDAPYRLPRFYLTPVDETYSDFDNDDLADVVEFVYGTDPNNPDSDNDGIQDGAEVEQGTDPLGGLIAQTGIIGTADTPGTAVDVCVTEETAVVADSGAGVSVFNVFNGMNPSIIAQVDTPGNAQAVACAGNLVAVADGQAGLAIVDITDPPAAQIIHQVALTAGAREVTAVGNLAYVASSDEIVLVDLPSGTIIDRHSYSGGPIHDVAISGDFLYILSVNGVSPHTIHKVRAQEVLSPPVASLTLSDHPTFGRMHIFAGGGFVYVGAADESWSNQVPGIGIISDSESTLSLIGPPSAITAFDVAVNGSGLALFTGADAGLVGSERVALLDVSDPTQTDRFLTAFETPGAAAAISIYNGLAYVADRSAGLQVINYQSYDAQSVSPSLTLESNYAPGVAEEDALMRITANATDDVQVRHVEFDIDGVQQFSDGSFPFEYRFTTPRIADQSTFTLTVRAIDTGGNDSEVEQLITLVPDATPPYVTGVTPSANSIAQAGALDTISVTFSEPIDSATLTDATFQLFTFGPDGIPANGDDVPVTGGTISYDADTLTASLNFSSALPADRYRAVVAPPLADLAGNPLAAESAWTFELVPFIQIGDVVSGEISFASEIDTYFFSAEAGQQVYFDVQQSDFGITGARWLLTDQSGETVFDYFLGDMDVQTLTQGGTYTLIVNADGANTGTYSFQMFDVPPPDEFTINIGDVVSDGSPGVGAGNIESPGRWNIYTFQASAGQQVYFDVQESEIYFANINWKLVDQNGETVFDYFLVDIDVQTLTQGGTYTLIVNADGANTGTYSFQLLDVPPPDEFTFNIGDVVSDGVPGVGAGNIESPGRWDIYTFQASAGQKVYFDVQESEIYFANIDWKLVDQNGETVFDYFLVDIDVQTLTQGGTYTLIVNADGASTGTYSFQMLDVPPPDELMINIGDVVSDGSPGVGAGNIESPGRWNVYTFQATAGQQVYFDVQQSDFGTTGANWSLTDQTGTQLFSSFLLDVDVQTLAQGGTYTLIVDARGASTGTYSFQLIDQSQVSRENSPVPISR